MGAGAKNGNVVHASLPVESAPHKSGANDVLDGVGAIACVTEGTAAFGNVGVVVNTVIGRVGVVVNTVFGSVGVVTNAPIVCSPGPCPGLHPE